VPVESVARSTAGVPGPTGTDSQAHKDYGLALATLREQHRLARVLNKPEVMAVALGHQAAIYELTAEFTNAVDFYQQAELICRQSKLLELLARNLANQAHLVSTKLDRHPKALKLAEEAYGLATKTRNEKLAEQIKKIYQDISSRHR